MMSIVISILYAIAGGGIYFVITYKMGLFNRIIGFRFRKRLKHETES